MSSIIIGYILSKKNKMVRKSTEEKKSKFIELWKNKIICNERLKDSNTWIEKMPKKKRTLTDYKYKKRIKEAIVPSKEYMEMMHKNYPDLTEKQILDLLKKQKKYRVSFHHQHEWITAELIKKYLLLDKYDSDVVKITLDTPEMHDCNLVKLTPELQEKAYWGYRWGRRVVSHIINKEDYPYENKTNKLTVVWKWEIDSYYDREIDDWVEGEPYFLVITAFRWEWNSRREILDEDLWHWNLDKYDDINDCAKFWLEHALIPEEDEEIYIEEEPFWVKCYKNWDL